jgi:hypothetical protein
MPINFLHSLRRGAHYINFLYILRWGAHYRGFHPHRLRQWTNYCTKLFIPPTMELWAIQAAILLVGGGTQMLHQVLFLEKVPGAKRTTPTTRILSL